jgi:soluble lytic murein transglycosylase-like protein
MIKKILVYVSLTIVLVFGFISISKADGIEEFSKIDIYTHWILENNNNHISNSMARNIVKDVILEADEISVSPELLLAMIFVESGFKVRAVSHEGAVGLLQVLPRSHPEFNRNKLYIYSNNIKYGGTILSIYLSSHGGRLKYALKQYNGSNNFRYSNKVIKVAMAIRMFKNKGVLNV